MPYPYGTNSGPSGRLVAPGLPRRQSSGAVGDIAGFPAKIFVLRADQLIRLPDWVTYVRMGATGKGGNGYNDTSVYYPGGGGGGFAGTNIIRVNPGALLNVRFDSTGTIIEALGYRLVGANGGNTAQGVAGAGGIGSGGDVNFTGGNGAPTQGTTATGCGGGAAGRGGNGVSATSGSGTGGAGAPGTGYFSGSGGGGGTSGGGAAGASPSIAAIGAQIITIGLAGSTAGGGDGGGGAHSAMTGTSTILGGAGHAIIELW